MDEQSDPRREKKVKLVARPGETSVFIDAEIDEQGNLLLSGQDIGKAPKDWFGHDDYEYWVVVAASEKDHVMSILLGQVVGGQQFRPAGDASEDEKDWALLTVTTMSSIERSNRVVQFGRILQEDSLKLSAIWVKLSEEDGGI